MFITVIDLQIAENKQKIAKEERKRLVSKIAAYVYATAVLEQEDSSCHVYFDDIERHFGREFFPKRWRKDIELLKEIQNEILSYPGCEDNADGCWLDISGYDEYGDPCPSNKHSPRDDAFNLCLWTNYIACDYDADEAEEY